MTLTCSCGKFCGSRAKNPPRVLVLDDEPLVRWSLVAGLSHAGFDAVPAASPDVAMALVRQVPRPEVVLLDVRLWGADPRRLLEQIRAESPESRVMILAVEGQDLAPPLWEGIDVIRKPFDLHDVIARVEAALPCRAHEPGLAV